MRTETGQVFRLSEYRAPDFKLETVALTFRLDAAQTEVEAVLSVTRADGAPADTPLVLDGDALQLVSLALNGEPLAADHYVATPDRLTINDLPDGPFELTIVTRTDPQANTQLMGLYRTGGNYCTQCEAEGFRRITYFLDRPDVLSVYTVRIEADAEENPLLLSNGNRIEAGTLDNGRHFAVWHDPHPKPSYLFALFAGNLGCLRDRFVTASGRDVALEIYVEHGKEQRATYAMDALIRSMRWDEERFGREYDLDIFMIVAVPDFNMGAMENKGLNIFNDKYVLADPKTATDQDYANIEAIIAHEYFHNWTGNRITCRDWFQLCLKEGLTVYRDHEFSADMRDRAVKRIAEVRLLRAQQFPEDSGPLAHPVRPREYSEINNFYTATVYEKGSEVVRMLHTILGEDGFRAGLDLYFDRHDGEACTIEQFLACFTDATGADLTQFSRWYDRPGTPNLTVSTDYDHKAQRLTVTVDQALTSPLDGSVSADMHIPVAFGLVGPDGDDLGWTAVSGAKVDKGVLHVTETHHSITFEGVAREPVLSMLRGFSAPVTVRPALPLEKLAFLAAKDSDPFARWEAINRLAISALTARTNNGPDADVEDRLVESLLALADDAALGPAFRALCLTLPSEMDIGREISHDIDQDRIHAAREALAARIAAEGGDVFTALYQTHQPGDAFSPDAASAGHRALAGAALTYLSIADDTLARAHDAYRAADNMTERAHALQLLAHRAPEADATVAALADFAAEFRNDTIVLDKWFMIQATIPGAHSLDRVKRLSAQPSFQWSNPNRVRALVGAFASANPTGFNRVDGAGYRYLCETVGRLDEKNPQLAARMITAMRSWRSLEPTRRSAAHQALRQLADRTGLSSDLRDIVARTLGREKQS